MMAVAKFDRDWATGRAQGTAHWERTRWFRRRRTGQEWWLVAAVGTCADPVWILKHWPD